MHANYCRIIAFSTRVRLFLSLAGENSDTFSRASYCGCVLVRSIEEKTLNQLCAILSFSLSLEKVIYEIDLNAIFKAG